ncbi:hypothetical protein SKAU_G00231620 [Synaphobranchus kaupii]|uniref:TSC22 domain family protein 1 n=1 Tax=Synaphobranchus kaupii TaxID=118154 RepID=A0A9Q1ITE8_SYNKA|nr:hypothetical protein SKAU_G00231620 [Synaphobranchus kaupii]
MELDDVCRRSRRITACHRRAAVARNAPTNRERRGRRPATRTLPCPLDGSRRSLETRRVGGLVCFSFFGFAWLNIQQLRHFSISFLSSLLGTESSPVSLDNSSSGASVVAIDNKIEQAMDLVKSHLMYAVREEVEVLKEQIKELIERNSQLEQENNLLKNLASPEQLAQFQAQVQSGSPPPSAQPAGTGTQQPAPPAQTASQTTGPSA